MENTQPQSAVPEKGIDASAETAPVSAPIAPKGSLHQLEHISLQGAGWLNLIGDVGLLSTGFAEKKEYPKFEGKYKIAAGALYTLGAANLAFLGRPDGWRLENDIANKTATFLSDKGIKPPPHSEFARYHPENQSYVYRAQSWLSGQPAQNTMMLYTGGAAAMLGAGWKKYRRTEGKEWKLLGYGTASFLTKTATMLIPEKAAEEKPLDPNAGFVEKAMHWASEKPLRLFGYSSLITDSLLALDNYDDLKKQGWNKKTGFQALTSVTYILADILMTLSHKDPENVNVTLSEKQLDKLMHQTAETLRMVPEGERERAVHEVADFLAEQKQVKEKPRDIAQQLRAQLDMPTPEPSMQVAEVTQHDALMQNAVAQQR